MYSITDPPYNFNRDQVELSLRETAGNSLRKGVNLPDEMLVTTVVCTREKLDSMTVIGVVNLLGDHFKPVIMSICNPHYRKPYSGATETDTAYFSPEYVHSRDCPGVYRLILRNLARPFIVESEHLEEEEQKMLAIFARCGCYIDLIGVERFCANGIMVLDLPPDKSHVFQPLHVSIFGPLKYFVQKEFRRVRRSICKVGTFEIRLFLQNEIQQAFTYHNVSSGFVKTGIWKHSTGMADETPLCCTKYYTNNPTAHNVLSVSDDVGSLSNRNRTLLGDVVLKEGTFRLEWTRGARITSANSLRDYVTQLKVGAIVTLRRLQGLLHVIGKLSIGKTCAKVTPGTTLFKTSRSCSISLRSTSAVARTWLCWE